MQLIQKMKQEMQTFWHDEEGSISVVMVILLPVLLWLTSYFEDEMQARYVYTQMQTVMDLATKAGATTGEAVQTGNQVFCTIPYNPTKPDYSGYHVAVKVLQDNLNTLPQDVQNQIQELIDTKKIKDLDNTDTRAAGYVEMSIEFTYQPSTPLFFSHYVMNLSSSARCQAVPNTSGNSGSVMGNPSWTGPVLNPQIGTVQGPSGKETYYNLDMSGVVSIMEGMGIEGPYWVREDGVKMYGDYVMVAADLSIHPRGSLVETSLGTGIVCDTGTFIYSNPTQLDIAVAW